MGQTHWRLQHGQTHDELAALSLSAVGLDPSTVDVDQFLYQRQSNAKTTLGAVQRSLCLREKIEDVREKVG